MVGLKMILIGAVLFVFSSLILKATKSCPPAIIAIPVLCAFWASFVLFFSGFIVLIVNF